MLCTAICTFPSRFFARYRMILIFVVSRGTVIIGPKVVSPTRISPPVVSCRVVLRLACVTRLPGTRPLGHVVHVFLAVLGLYSP